MIIRSRRARIVWAGMLLLALAAPAPALADLFGRTAPVDPSPQQAATPDAIAPFDAATLAEGLPRAWRGTFAWEEGVAYYVEMEIVSLSVRDSGEIGFIAESRWSPGDLLARMSGRIDPTTLELRIWEVPDDASADGFDSDGQYDGVVATDLWDLRATWVTGATGQAGTLVLVAKAPTNP
ncbi:MAG: hypothetical protein ACFCVH_07870 [Alphaproteobacteria bacterium]